MKQRKPHKKPIPDAREQVEEAQTSAIWAAVIAVLGLAIPLIAALVRLNYQARQRKARPKPVPYTREDPGPIGEQLTRQQLDLATKQIEVAREQNEVARKQIRVAIWATIIAAVGLYIPIIVVVVSHGYQAQLEREIALDGVLQAYFDRMSQLLLEENFNSSRVRGIATVRTLTTLSELDGSRKGALLRFIHKADLITASDEVTKTAIIDLSGADLSRIDLREIGLIHADLSKVNLNRADLSRVILIQADLTEADLTEADLTGALLLHTNLIFADLKGGNLRGAILNDANLSGADLSGAVLSGAVLNRADLRGTNLSGANLGAASLSGADLGATGLSRADLGATSLNGATYDETTLWPKDFDPDAAGAVKGE